MNDERIPFAAGGGRNKRVPNPDCKTMTEFPLKTKGGRLLPNQLLLPGFEEAIKSSGRLSLANGEGS